MYCCYSVLDKVGWFQVFERSISGKLVVVLVLVVVVVYKVRQNVKLLEKSCSGFLSYHEEPLNLFEGEGKIFTTSLVFPF